MRITIRILLSLSIIFAFSFPAQAKTFKIASYNVENLFDLVRDKTEYSEYIPNNPYGWNEQTFNIKLSNIAKVIKDLGADIMALQEIESEKALILLQQRLKEFNVDYPYLAIADSKPTAVKCALLSKFPILSKKEIKIRDEAIRNILMCSVEIDNTPLIIFINHWKSKQGPESMRIAYAKALKKELKKIKNTTDFIILGDFNSNYNEYKTFLSSSKFNDTSGITGINHILKTVKNQQLVNEDTLREKNNSGYLYNLWLELDAPKRWSYNCFGRKDSPDSMILGLALYDNKGISYVDNSFDRFNPDYLFKGDEIYRWQMSKRGKGKHLGLGYSDHLPVFAYFSTEPFQSKDVSVLHDEAASFKKFPEEELVDINSATDSQLRIIPGIGKVLSKMIIAGRPYKDINGLLNIKGIGEKTLEKLRPYLSIIKKE
ncbi:MAG: helix-hairpin-helix domain-containing protein [Candidatus Omnitrophica bacterium]|nr:helix-hairpin-helix domain-containing protein [Candidatus Omnitrophota bacterium]